MRVAMPDLSRHDKVDNIYRALVNALPEKSDTSATVSALGMLLSAIIIENSKPGRRVQAAKFLCDKIMECVESVPSLEEIADDADDKPKYLN